MVKFTVYDKVLFESYTITKQNIQLPTQISINYVLINFAC